MANLDLLMIVHNRLEYLQKALPSVLNQDYKNFRLTIWDNASESKIGAWLYKTIPPLDVRIIFGNQNHSLATVTNEIFLGSDAEFVGKVDADMIIPPDWASRIIAKHKEQHYGFLGGFHFRPEDIKDLKPNIKNGVWEKHHIGGNYIIRRADFKGYKGEGVMGLSEYQAEMGWPNGYLWDPILWTDHMEDARSSHYINNQEYADYKIKTRGMSLDQYQTSIVNMNYLKENTL